MKNIILVALITAITVFAQWPSGGPYQLRWGAVTNGGTEAEMRESPSGYFLADNLGANSYVTDSFLIGGAYKNRPGYRKGEWDERYPFTSVDSLGADTISSGPNFPITWGGADTTLEDGIGWGIRYYDVQFKRNIGGAWRDWFIHTTLASDVFGPLVPDTVFEDTNFFFRCRGYDKAGNVEPWPLPTVWQAWARYEQQILQWEVVNYGGGNSWTIGPAVTLGSTTTADSTKIFIVKNRSTTDIDMGIKGYPATGWALQTTPGFDRYTVKARYDDNPRPPVVFDMTDVVYDSGFTWATATYYGPGGFAIQGTAADSVYRTENLWLQLQTPLSVSVWRPTQTIRLDLKAKPSTP